MKKIVSVLFAMLLLALCLPMGVSAEVVSAEDYLTFELVDGSYTVTDCVQSYKGDLIIPAEKDGKPVTAIGNTAFFGCRSLTKVILPDSITTIGNQAFQGCTSLRDVVLSPNVTAIGFAAFHDTNLYNASTNWEKGVLYVGDCAVATAETVKDTVYLRHDTRLIAADAFYGRDMTAVFIPETVTHVNTRAFGECDKLTEVLYGGKKAGWQKIAIAGDNKALQSAKVRYNALGKKISPWLWVSIASGVAAIAVGAVMLWNRKKAKSAAAAETAPENSAE